jgi:hypothetical protein
VDRRIVVMKEPVVVVSKFRSLLLRIFSQASQNIIVKVRVDRRVISLGMRWAGLVRCMMMMMMISTYKI